jgi:type IV secretion system protein VirD4
VRYFKDRDLARRVGAPPPLQRPSSPGIDQHMDERPSKDWRSSDLPPTLMSSITGEGGPRLEPDRLAPDLVVRESPAPPEFEDFDDDLDLAGPEAEEDRAEFQRRNRLAARQASLDPGDGIDL